MEGREIRREGGACLEALLAAGLTLRVSPSDAASAGWVLRMRVLGQD